MKYVFLSLLMSIAALAHADRYYTWVDEYGTVRHTVIPQGSEGAAAETRMGDGKLQEPELVKSLASTPTVEAASVDELDPDDYVDAEELQRRGYVRPEQDARFYTWMDHNGVIHSSPYPPVSADIETGVKVEKGTSPFVQVERFQHQLPIETAPVDDFARSLFQLDLPPQGRLGKFRKSCCNELSATEIVEIDLDDGYTIEFDGERDAYPFTTGDSVYQLVRLPASQHEYMLQIRSFVRSEVFYPALLFLNQRFEPQRLVTQVVHDFEPENWFRYGYLEGRVAVEPQHGDAYLLILTLKEDLRRQSLVTRKKREVAVKHSQQGLLHISIDKAL